MTRQDWEATRDRLLADGWKREFIGEAWGHFLEELDR